VTAVAMGDLKRKLLVEAKGEIAALADTFNNMIDTLATFADQVTTVAREVGVEGKLGGQASVPGAAGTWKDLTDNVNQLAANLTTQVRAIADVATAVTKGDLTRSIAVQAQGEVAALKDNINEMIRNLKDTTLKNSEQDWLKTNLAKFSRMLQGQKDLLTVGRLILSELAPVVAAQQGVFYTMEGITDEPTLKLLASYAFKERKNVDNKFRMGEGLVGQCALEKEKILLNNVPDDYIRINSGLGEAKPLNIIVLPVIFEGQVKAVMELASFEKFSTTHQTFLDQLTESIGIVLNTIEANMRTENLLKQSQSLARELQSQQEELQQTNQELEEKAKLLAEQNVEVERKNKEVEQARQALEEKARQLALTSRYKSEFLANMSHELRTPLNSLLILSDQLSKNVEGNLSTRQVEFAKTIHGSGNDLLALINDILDLSKIESGTVMVDISDLRFKDMQDYVERTFRHVAETKSLGFGIHLAHNLPRTINTDSKRLQQVIKNLLSNAFKFTDKGRVSLSIEPVTSGWSHDHEGLHRASEVMAFIVTDTGIGIQAEKQQIIFEAFQQADGSTSRKYGGTGLGLAISREIARLLGGEVKLVSKPGEGSTFTLYLPQNYTPMKSMRQTPLPALPPVTDSGATATVETEMDAAPRIDSEVHDDKNTISPGDRVLMIVEDDAAFARIMVDAAHEKGFKCVVASRGVRALALAAEIKPQAITLDLSLPDIDGWRVLHRLKDDLATRHIPVHMISLDDEHERGFKHGVVSFSTKPVTTETINTALDKLIGLIDRPGRELMLVDSDEVQRAAIEQMLGGEDVKITVLSDGMAALDALRTRPVDCVVVGMNVQQLSVFDFAEQIKQDSSLQDMPVILYAPGEISRKDETALKRLLKGANIRDVRSIERLLDESSLFLHRFVARLPSEKRQMLEKLHQTDAVLAQKKVLIVDDDIRNIFAMTSVLERHNMSVVPAETGISAIEILHKQPGIDVVLMDIMMPEMDGYDTMRAIRKNGKFKSLPIIALTAKAMKGDREKCIEAGASDYVSKPVDTEQLLSLLRVWLYR